MAEAEPRSSRYPGVTRHKRRGKFQVMFWDTATRKQVYLGYYDDEGGAARAHDLAALKYYGTGQDTKLNFSISDYEKEIKIMETMSKDEFVAYIKRQSNYFRKGTSSYRGVTRVEGDKWLARICKAGNCINLGWFETEEEAAQAYDIAAIELFGPCAYTNIDNTNSSEDGLKKPKGPSDLSELEGAGLAWKGERRTSTRIRSRPLRDWIGERFIYGRIYDLCRSCCFFCDALRFLFSTKSPSCLWAPVSTDMCPLQVPYLDKVCRSRCLFCVFTTVQLVCCAVSFFMLRLSYLQ